MVICHGHKDGFVYFDLYQACPMLSPQDIQAYNNLSGDFPYPIIDDEDRNLAVSLGMLDPDEKTSEGMPLTCRAVFIIGTDKKLKLSILYPATTGRNFK